MCNELEWRYCHFLCFSSFWPHEPLSAFYSSEKFHSNNHNKLGWYCDATLSSLYSLCIADLSLNFLFFIFFFFCSLQKRLSLVFLETLVLFALFISVSLYFYKTSWLPLLLYINLTPFMSVISTNLSTNPLFTTNSLLLAA